MSHSTITSRALCFRWPVRKGGQWSLYGTGKGNTEQLASKTHLNLAGDTVDTFSALSGNVRMVYLGDSRMNINLDGMTTTEK